MHPTIATGLLLTVAACAGADAATWQVAAGPTRSDGSALEIARGTSRWETAVGYISNQQVNVRTVQDTCYTTSTGPSCITATSTAKRSVDSYAYLSLQRRFSFRRSDTVRPLLGFGIVANTKSNAYVSSPVTFSLSAGLAIGNRWSLEWRHFSNAGLEQPNLGQDVLLLRTSFGPGGR